VLFRSELTKFRSKEGKIFGKSSSPDVLNICLIAVDEFVSIFVKSLIVDLFLALKTVIIN
jgi:hypothetical protein